MRKSIFSSFMICAFAVCICVVSSKSFAWQFEKAVVCEDIEDNKPVEVTEKRWEEGDTPYFYVNINDVEVDHRYKYIVKKEGEYLFSYEEDEDNWREVEEGAAWSDSSMYGYIEDVTPGDYKVIFFIDFGDGFEELASVEFSAGKETKSFMFPFEDFRKGRVVIKNFGEEEGEFELFSLKDGMSIKEESGDVPSGKTEISLDRLEFEENVETIWLRTKGAPKEIYVAYQYGYAIEKLPEWRKRKELFAPFVSECKTLHLQNWNGEEINFQIEGYLDGQVVEEIEITVQSMEVMEEKLYNIFSEDVDAIRVESESEKEFFGLIR